jgi:DNA-binding NtrC family response regulator
MSTSDKSAGNAGRGDAGAGAGALERAGAGASELLGRSAVFRAFRAELERAAVSDAVVLLEGESGAGKSAAARHLHRCSRRAGGPFVALPLAALSPALIESDLFGHERGAFTGAERARAGAFARAQGGTLLLDEIDLLPRECQVKLLRALQERSVEPLGGAGPVAVDARVVAASARPLAGEVRAGRFRGDLYWRLAVVRLEVPPLRTRLEDLPELCAALAARAAARLGVAPREIAPEGLARLAEHAWPGNVRELEHALERVLVLAPRSAAGAAVPIEPAELDFLRRETSGAADDLARLALARRVTLAEFERALLAAALEEARGNLSRAARLAGLTRRAFEYRRSQADARPGEPRATSAEEGGRGE